MAKITEIKNSIVLENNYAEITLSKKNALVEKILDKKNGKDIKNEDTYFFSFVDADRETVILPTDISVKGDVIVVDTPKGKMEVKVTVFDNYFVFELVSELPTDIFKAEIADMSFVYDTTDKASARIAGIAMTYWIDPNYFPDGTPNAYGITEKNEKMAGNTKGTVYPHLQHKNAKLAIILCPTSEQRDLIKEVCRTIDRNVGLMSEIGGAWGRDSRLNFGNYIIEGNSDKAYVDANLEFYKAIGVDQIDYHQGMYTVRQGDFKMERYDSAADFKKNVSDVLEANGIASGLHTYSHYIRYDCDTILSDPKWQKDLGVLGEYTLSEDVSADAEFLPTDESTENVPPYISFFAKSSPLVLIGNEIINFAHDKQGFKVTKRGVAGTKAVAHKKGEKIKHLDGFYHGVAPVSGSELFLQIARNTAKAFNEGGFKMIYLDALDGLSKHCEKYEYWYYTAMFVCEILKYCDEYPLIEFSTFFPALYAARGRVGAHDTPYRSYKHWNEHHAFENRAHIDRYLAPTFGWYNFYPQTDVYPGNEHTKYHHTDSIARMGALALMYDFSNVFNGTNKYSYERYAGVRRNVALYKKYDDLRKSLYFDEEYRQKLIDSPFEVELIEKRGKKFSFVEKDYQIAKLYDLNDTERNYGSFKNPFGAQVPFIRIEAMMSTAGDNPFVMLPLDENKDLITQKLEVNYGGEIDLADKLAKKVRVFGNGKGGKICIKTRCGSNSELGYGEYIVDVNFKGWREFILLESDNGERKDHSFEKGEGLYPTYRSSLNHNRTNKLTVHTEGDMEGVRMSSITACDHVYEVLKNPTVKIGEMGIMFECELKSTDFIEFDGKTAKVVDRYGNEMPIWFTSNLKAPRGKFKAELTARALNRCTPRAQLTLGFTGKEIK
ncbi:MAG: hypothetical protein E7613_00580 [Ruminococcaceae bacterium]|nr:hypothetical protein [Oscillospiraceae bacterium]